jgi:hypothetical protein
VTRETPRTAIGLTSWQVALHVVLAGVAGGMVYAVSADPQVAVVGTLVGCVWFYAGMVYGYGEAVGI